MTDTESKPTSEQTERKGFTRDDDGNEVHFTKRMVTIKPTSEGARTLDETVNEIVHGIWCRYAEEEIPTKDFDADKAIVTKAIDTYAAPFRSQLAAAEAQAKEYNAMTNRAMDRAEAAESEIQRLRERIAELETVKNAAIELDAAITEEFGADHEFQDDRWAKAQKALKAELEGRS